ncbi:hypothetical protein ACQI4L_09055 [Mycolicibacterium litorale]|uniref:hypothetical protein n=1 Tax=Mycolicibacterium litorale TaxID=758802 RepID=UPI003CFB7A34
MTEPIGYIPVQLIPVMKGFSAEVDKQVSGMPGLGRSAGKKLGDGIAAGVGDGMKAAEKAVETSTRKIEQLKDKVANATDNVRLAEQRYQEAVEKGVSGARLTAAANARERTLRQQASLTRDLTRETERLERAQKDLAEGAGAERGGESAGSSFLDGFTGGIAALATKAGPIGAAITAAAGVALAGGAIIGSQVMAGMEREVASDRIAAHLGLNDTEMARFGDVAGRTYASNFGESMGDVGDALAAVTSTLGRDTPTAVLEEMTQKALTFRDVFGAEVSESIAFAQNLIVNGLAPNAESAFDMMVTAYQRVPVAMRDELPEILSEYSTYFESLGFSGEEAFGMLVNTAPKGTIALDKLGDSLKEFTLLATDIGAKPVQDALAGMGMVGADVANNLLAGGPAAQQQFDAIIDGLLRIPDAGEQAAAAIALFGTPLEDLDKAKIPEFLRSLDDGQRAMEGFTGAADGMVKTAGDNAAGTVESAKRAVELAAGGMQDSLAEAFGPGIEQLATFITDHQAEITGFFSGIGEVSAIAGEAILIFVAESTGALADIVNAVGDSYGAVMTAAAGFADLVGDDDRAAEFRRQAEAGYGLADSLYEMEAGARTAAGAMSDAADNFGQTKDQAGLVAQNVERISGLMAALPGGKQIDISAIVTYKDTNGIVIAPDQLTAPVRAPAVPGETRRAPGRASGGIVDPSGRISGPGSGTSDSVLAAVMGGSGGFIRVSNEESINTAASTRANWPVIEAMNAGAQIGEWFKSLPSFAGGGVVSSGASQLKSILESQWPVVANADAGRRDGPGEHASGNALDIMLGSDYKSPEKVGMGDSIAQFLLDNAGVMDVKWVIWNDKIYKPGQPPAVYGNPSSGDDNNQHRNHLHVFLTGKGAKAPSFDSSQLLGSGSSSSFAGGSAIAAATGGVATPGYGPNGEAGTYEPLDGKALREAEQKVADADVRIREAEAKQRELEADAKESQRISAQADVDRAKREAADARADLAEVQKGKFTPGDSSSSSSASSFGAGSSSGLSLPSSFSGFGSAIGEFAGGQIGSALEVFGVGDSPPWLQAASKFISGISVSDSNGNSLFDGGNLFGGAAPSTATPMGAGVPPPDDAGNVHGTRANQAPGPVYNITARDTEDAFIRAQRVEREKAAAKLSRF